MSINAILNNALSGMTAMQTVLRTVSDNVANVNTLGYVRKHVDLQTRAVAGAGAGVEVSDIRRMADAYLRTAYLTANNKLAVADAKALILDRLQSSFGDPSDSSSVFGRLNGVFSQFGAAGVDPSSLTARRSITGDLTDLFAEFSRLGDEI